MRIRPRIQVALALILVIGLASLAIPPAKAVVIYEYGMAGTPIPWSMTIDKDGAIWITEQGTNKIAKLYGGIFEWSIPTPGAVPWGITCSKDHADIWFTEETQGKIGKFSPSYPGVFYEWTLPDPLNARPRGIAMNITKLSNGNKTPANSVWFTLFQKHRIGYMYVDNANQATFSFYPLPDDDTYPMDIVMSPIDYSVWFTEYGTGQIGSIKLLDDGSALIKHYATSATNSKPWGIAVDPKGFVWITESATNCLGRLNPASGEYVTFTLPTPNAEPRGLAIEAYTTQPYDVINVWFTEYNSDKIGRYNPSMNVFYEYSVITTGSRPYGIAVTGPGGNVWFTEPFAQKIGYLYQGNPIVSYTTVGTITSALTTSMTSSVVRTTTASTTTAAAAAISAVMSTTAPVTTVTMTQTFTSSKMYMTSTSIYSYTLTSRSTSYTTSTSTTTYTQVSISTSTLSTSTTTIATSTSFIVETSTFQTSRTDTIVLTSTSLTTNTLTMTSTSIYPTVTATAMNTSFMITTTFSPTITVTSFQTSVVPTTSTVTSFLSTTTTTTTSVAITRPCVIASAAYGSELAPEVQFLREFRDRSVTSSFAGGQFMKAFNEFYYSFSPTVARLTASHSTLSTGVRALIYPLVGSLHVAATAFQELRHLNLELAILLSGVLASCLIGIAYVSPIMLVRAFLGRRQKDLGGR
jgi:virginiamycin B lyase